MILYLLNIFAYIKKRWLKSKNYEKIGVIYSISRKVNVGHWRCCPSWFWELGSCFGLLNRKKSLCPWPLLHQLPEQIPFLSLSRKIPSGTFPVPFRSHVLRIRRNGGFRSLLLPRPNDPRTQKFPAGTQVELNQADSLTLQKVPGIGPVFSRRIIKYRDPFRRILYGTSVGWSLWHWRW